MAILSSLDVNVVGRLLNWKRTTNTVRKDTKAMKKDVMGLDSALKNAFKFSIAGLSVAVITQQFRGVAEEIDEIGKASVRLGIGVQTLEAWRRAAERAGVGTKSFDTAFQRMVRRIGDASRRGGPLLKVFESLGFNIKELARLNPETQFRAISDAIGSIANQNLKLSVTSSIFDTEGVRLVNLFGANLRQAEVDFESLTGRMSQEGVASVEAMNDAFADLGLVIKDIKRDVTLEFAPELRRLALFLIRLIRGGFAVRDFLSRPIGESINIPERIASTARVNQPSPAAIAADQTRRERAGELTVEGRNRMVREKKNSRNIAAMAQRSKQPAIILRPVGT